MYFGLNYLVGFSTVTSEILQSFLEYSLSTCNIHKFQYLHLIARD